MDTEERVKVVLHDAGTSSLRRHSSQGSICRMALVDGLINIEDDDLVGARISICAAEAEERHAPSAHATKVASILVGQSRTTLALCPEAELLNFPFVLSHKTRADVSSLVAGLTCALRDATDAGACVILLTVEFLPGFSAMLSPLCAAMRAAAEIGVRTVVPAGNSPILMASDLAAVPGAVPVVMAKADRPHAKATLAAEIAQHGLLAPGVDIPVARASTVDTATGSSFAAAIVAGAFVQLKFQFPKASNNEIWYALLCSKRSWNKRSLLVPPVLDIDASGATLAK
jgi:hypothetical protein